MHKCLGCDERYAVKTALCARCGGKDFIILADPAARDGRSWWSVDGTALCGLSMVVDGVLINGAPASGRISILHVLIGIALLIGHEKARAWAIALQAMLVLAGVVAGVALHSQVVTALISGHAVVMIGLLTEDRGELRGQVARIALVIYYLLAIAMLVAVRR